MTELIRRLLESDRRHTRAADWVFFAVCFTYAFRLCLPVTVLPPYFFPGWLDQFWWGVIFLVAALVQLFGLRIDYACAWAPAVRGAGIAAGVVPLSLLAAGLFLSQPYSLKICDVVIFVGIGLFCLFRAGKDHAATRG